MLPVLKVPLPAVMDVMGWSDAAIAKRYLHVLPELVRAIAQDVADLMWTRPEQDRQSAEDPEPTPEQRQAIRDLASKLPDRWAQHLTELLPDEDDDGPEGALIPA